MTPEDLDALVAYMLQIDQSESATPSLVPQISVARPSSGQVFGGNASILIGVDTSPTLGPVQHVEFYDGSRLLDTDDTPLYTLVWDRPDAGSHSISARLVYESGLSTTSRPVMVTIVP